MGRHRVPADSTTPEPSGAQRARRRTVGIATALVLTVGARPIPLIAIAIGPDADKAACDRIAKATGVAAYRVSDPAQIHQVLLKAVVDASSATTATS
jgi:hypothetical protein